MGLSVSSCYLDHVPVVDSVVQKLLYRPPEQTPEMKLYMNLCKTTPNCRYLTLEYSGLKIELVVVWPSSQSVKLELSARTERVLVFAHGNSCDIYTLLPFCMHMADQLETCVVSFDYPAFGNSSGYLSEDTCVRSLEMVMSWVLKNVCVFESQVTLVGQSLGTGVVVGFARRTHWTQPIVLISPFTSVPRILVDHCAFDGMFGKHGFSSLEKAEHLSCPAFIFHGTQDEIVPVSHAQALGKKMRNATVLIFEEANHNNILNFISMDVWKSIVHAQPKTKQSFD